MGEGCDRASGSPKTQASCWSTVRRRCARRLETPDGQRLPTTNAGMDLCRRRRRLRCCRIVDVGQGTLYAFDATAIDGEKVVMSRSTRTLATAEPEAAVTDSAHDVATGVCADRQR
jgi:hypothetical protein